jgi:hypothetical protein
MRSQVSFILSTNRRVFAGTNGTRGTQGVSDGESRGLGLGTAPPSGGAFVTHEQDTGYIPSQFRGLKFEASVPSLDPREWTAVGASPQVRVEGSY